MSTCPTLAFSLARQYAALANADLCDGLRAVSAGNNRADVVSAPGDEYLTLTPIGWAWATEPDEEEEYTNSDRWENEMENRRENQRNYHN